jgi:plastocyanin
MIRIFLAAVLAGGLLAAGALRAAPAGSTVGIDNFAFTPATITVAAGTKVVWTNSDDIPHTVLDAATARTFRSKPLDTGDSFAFTFTTPGTYQYICSLHPFMKGTVVVK